MIPDRGSMGALREIDQLCPLLGFGSSFVPHVKERRSGGRSTKARPKVAAADARGAQAQRRVRDVWTRVIADTLYERWRAEGVCVETTSLLGAKNGNAPERGGGERAREEVQE